MLSAVIRGPAAYVNRESTTDQSRTEVRQHVRDHRPGVSNTSEVLGRPDTPLANEGQGLSLQLHAAGALSFRAPTSAESGFDKESPTSVTAVQATDATSPQKESE